jgi:membrane-bound lytic murein transglycosylase D
MMMRRNVYLTLLIGLGLGNLFFVPNTFIDNTLKAIPNAFQTPLPNTPTAGKDTLKDKYDRPLSTSIDDLFILNGAGKEAIQLNPKAVNFVQDFMETNGTELIALKSWGRPYFTLMDNILKNHGLPGELKYLTVIESKLKSSAVSRAGAVGPWQLMPETARLLGLKVNRGVDERKDYVKSTKAAALYLNDLYGEFQDWLLVIAAYNGGPANVYNAIRKSNSRDFWVLERFLPLESRLHVKKFIATHYIFEGTGGITTLTKEETDKQLKAVSQYISLRNLSQDELKESRSIRINGKYHSEAICKIIIMNLTEFNRYNPNFDKVMASAVNSYELKLPAEKMDRFISSKYQILNESVQILLNGATAATPFLQ